MISHKDPQTLFTGIDQQKPASSGCLCDQAMFQGQSRLPHAAFIYPCRSLQELSVFARQMDLAVNLPALN